MNKTVLFVTYATVASIGLLGAVTLLLFRPDATASFITLLVTVLTIVATSAATFNSLSKQGEKIEEVKKQTNGTLTKLLARNRELEEENSYLVSERVNDKITAKIEEQINVE